jgi:hypothetical protein
MAVNSYEIAHTFRQYFIYSGGFHISPSTGLITVSGSVYLKPMSTTRQNKLPVAFDQVYGNFDCADRGLISLEGAPRHVEFNFSCEKNQLVDLVGAPKTVNGNFVCTENKLKTLEGGPVYVGGKYQCWDNALENLIGSPYYVRTEFVCRDNKLTTLKGAPFYVGRNFICHANPDLKSLENMPNKVGNHIICDYKPDLKLCGLLLCDCPSMGIVNIPNEVKTILYKYKKSGYAGMLPFSTELIKAGYGSNAWL